MHGRKADWRRRPCPSKCVGSTTLIVGSQSRWEFGSMLSQVGTDASRRARAPIKARSCMAPSSGQGGAAHSRYAEPGPILVDCDTAGSGLPEPVEILVPHASVTSLLSSAAEMERQLRRPAPHDPLHRERLFSIKNALQHELNLREGLMQTVGRQCKRLCSAGRSRKPSVASMPASPSRGRREIDCKSKSDRPGPGKQSVQRAI